MEFYDVVFGCVLFFYCLIGHPQMFKLVQSTGKALGGIVTSAIAAGQPLKIIKTVSAGGQDQQQSPQQVRFCFVAFFYILWNSRFCY